MKDNAVAGDWGTFNSALGVRVPVCVRVCACVRVCKVIELGDWTATAALYWCCW